VYLLFYLRNAALCVLFTLINLCKLSYLFHDIMYLASIAEFLMDSIEWKLLIQTTDVNNRKMHFIHIETLNIKDFMLRRCVQRKIASFHGFN